MLGCIELAFLKGGSTPILFKTIADASTFVFGLDILVNFNTGYVNSDGNTIMDRNLITKKYMATWFWLDLLSTVPFDLIFSEERSSLLVLIRFAKAIPVLKTLRVAKPSCTLALLIRHMQGYAMFRGFEAHCEMLNYLVLASKVMFALLCVAHLNGCLYGAAYFDLTSNFGLAIDRHYQCVSRA